MAEDWDQGSKKPSKAQLDKDAAKKAAEARKAENARLLVSLTF